MKIVYPIYFLNNTCVHCGSKGSLFFIDSRNTKTHQPVYPIEKIVCTNCKTEYFIKWIKSHNDEMIPVCCSKDDIKDFEDDIIMYTLKNKRVL